MSPVFRRYADDDLLALVQLVGQLGYEHTPQGLATNVAQVRQAGGEVFVAEVEAQVRGCVCAILDVRLAAGRHGEIVSLVVDESARGRGLGRGLVDAAERWLRARVTQVRVRANTARTSAPEFYEKLGYARLKTQAVFTKALPPDRPD